MNDFRFPENRITKIALTLFLFFQLYLCRDSMFGLYVVGFYPSQIISLGLTAVLGLVFLWYQRGNWKAVFTDGRIVIAALAAAIMLLPMVLKRDWQFMYLSILSYILSAIVVSYAFSWRDTAKCYVVMLTALGIYSMLAAYVFRIPIDMGLVEKGVFRDGRDVGIYNFIFSIAPRTFEKHRNFGMFREPGVYQYFILLALYLTHYGVTWKKEWAKWTVTAVLCITMVTTLATGGVAEMCLLAAFVFLEKKLYKNKVFLILAIVLVLLVVGVLYYSYEEQNDLWLQFYLMTFNKFSGEEDSLNERMEAIVSNLEMFGRHPILGGDLSEVLHRVANNTSSTLILFAGFGICAGAFHVLTWAALVWDKQRSAAANLILLVILFLSFNTQNLSWNIYFWLLPVMALSEKAPPVINCRQRKGTL